MCSNDIEVNEITTGIANVALDEVDQLTEQLTSLKLEDEWNGEPMDIDPLPLVRPAWKLSVPRTTYFDLRFCSIVVTGKDIDMLDAYDEMDSDANNDSTELALDMMDLDECTSSWTRCRLRYGCRGAITSSDNSKQ